MLNNENQITNSNNYSLNDEEDDYKRKISADYINELFNNFESKLKPSSNNNSYHEIKHNTIDESDNIENNQVEVISSRPSYIENEVNVKNNYAPFTIVLNNNDYSKSINVTENIENISKNKDESKHIMNSSFGSSMSNTKKTENLQSQHSEYNKEHKYSNISNSKENIPLEKEKYEKLDTIKADNNLLTQIEENEAENNYNKYDSFEEKSKSIIENSIKVDSNDNKSGNEISIHENKLSKHSKLSTKSVNNMEKIDYMSEKIETVVDSNAICKEDFKKELLQLEKNIITNMNDKERDLIKEIKSNRKILRVNMNISLEKPCYQLFNIINSMNLSRLPDQLYLKREGYNKYVKDKSSLKFNFFKPTKKDFKPISNYKPTSHIEKMYIDCSSSNNIPLKNLTIKNKRLFSPGPLKKEIGISKNMLNTLSFKMIKSTNN